MANYPRKQLLVDPRVQGALMFRTAFYWLACLSTILMMVLCWRIVTGPARIFYMHFDDMWFHFGPGIIAALLMLPLLIIDSLRMSNRFAGPLFRLRGQMRQVARGERVEPIRFRDGDFWHDMANEWNAVVARMQRDMPAASANAIDKARDVQEPEAVLTAASR